MRRNARRWEPKHKKYDKDWQPWCDDDTGTPTESIIERGTIELMGVKFTTTAPKQNGCYKLNRPTLQRIEVCENAKYAEYS